MGSRTLKRLYRNVAPVAALVLLLIVSLLLISGAIQDAARFERYYLWLLLFNAIGILVLTVMIAINLYRLIVQYRLRTIGSHLTARMVVVFVVLSLVPVTLVYYFSLTFLHRGIDSWFDVRIERALEDALQLGRAALDVRRREALQRTRQVARRLRDVPDGLIDVYLNQLRDESGATELILFGTRNEMITSSSDAPTVVPVQRPGGGLATPLKEGEHYVEIEPVPGAGLLIRVVVPITAAGPGTDTVGTLQALFPVTERVNDLTASVRQAFEQYKELAFLRDPLKYSLTLALSTVLLLAVLSAIWVAFFAARRLVAPIRDLVEGTKAVAAGDYGKRVPLSGRDELGFLLRSFNDMTQRVARARDLAEQSKRQETAQRTYLETVLERISSGVLTLDGEWTLRRVNIAASHILGVDLAPRVGRRLGELAADQPALGQLLDQIREPLERREREWSREAVLFGPGGRKVLMCRGALLPGEDGEEGHVVVFDDLTAIIQAQRDSAWSEMARRLAHEIKNPLTPIQLSAERLRHKFLPKLSGADGTLLDRATRTIVQQVDAMKDMVNAFNEYARAPQMSIDTLDLNELIRDVAEMYRAAPAGVRLRLTLEPRRPLVQADSRRLRQLLHNLLKNAYEAVGEHGEVSVTTRCIEEFGLPFVELRVEDSGAGMPEEIIARLGEPYVTGKPRGTGLGLAIVRKIVEEHGGKVWAENRPAGGASVVLHLPMEQEARPAERPSLRAGGGKER